MKFKFRDLLAVPIMFLAQALDSLAVFIGGAWTAELYIQKYMKFGEAKKVVDEMLKAED